MNDDGFGFLDHGGLAVEDPDVVRAPAVATAGPPQPAPDSNQGGRPSGGFGFLEDGSMRVAPMGPKPLPLTPADGFGFLDDGSFRPQSNRHDSSNPECCRTCQMGWGCGQATQKSRAWLGSRRIAGRAEQAFVAVSSRVDTLQRDDEGSACCEPVPDCSVCEWAAFEAERAAKRGAREVAEAFLAEYTSCMSRLGYAPGDAEYERCAPVLPWDPKECCVAVHCFPLPGVLGAVADHCAIIIKECHGSVTQIELLASGNQAIPFAGTATIVSTDMTGRAGPQNNIGSDIDPGGEGYVACPPKCFECPEDVEGGGGEEDPCACIKDAAKNYHSGGSAPYNPLAFGVGNSNTFVQDMMDDCAEEAGCTLPPRAIGANAQPPLGIGFSGGDIVIDLFMLRISFGASGVQGGVMGIPVGVGPHGVTVGGTVSW